MRNNRYIPDELWSEMSEPFVFEALPDGTITWDAVPEIRDYENQSKYSAELEKEELAIETGESNVEAEKVTVIGGVLNGATGIKFDKPSEADLNNAKVRPYNSKAAINIALSGAETGELKYPVLITMPAPA